MSDPVHGSVYHGESPGFDSRDVEVLISDGPGDTTVRPCRPLLRELALAECQRLADFEESATPPPTSDRPTDVSGAKNVEQ